ncbi:MAG: histidinol dehydrogenase [Candidatus Thorarchaeota archaeon]
MILLKEIKSDQITEESLSNYIPRASTQIELIKDKVFSIIQGVKEDGDTALIKYTKDFDKVELSSSQIRVSVDEILEAYEKSDKNLIGAIRVAKQNLVKFQQAQSREDWMIEIEEGVSAGQIYRPLDRLGIYIPGGKAIYPSTVLMIAAPAFVAGVKEIIMCSPPQQDTKIASAILIAANEFGINKIYKAGGAQAIAAMAYGTKTIPKVQKIIGPGNIWVNAAKKLLSDVIAIDTPAGPSEILIICDENTSPNYVVVDLLSQVEHDPDNIGIIVTDSEKLINQIKEIFYYYVKNSKRRDIIEKALENNSLIIKAKDIDDCIRLSNLIAPEHLEILTQNPNKLVKKIHNAGAVFLGPYSPVSLGDYCAGTNHVLPTGGSAKAHSGLNFFDFVKIIDVLKCEKKGLIRLSNTAIRLSELEGLHSHKNSIEERLKDKN